jgi:hypothetical protein
MFSAALLVRAIATLSFSVTVPLAEIRRSVAANSRKKKLG